MSQLDKIRNTFARKGYREKAFITQRQFTNLLEDLSGANFNEDVAIEIWDQAKLNVQNEASVNQLCSIIEEAQNILTQKLMEVSQNIDELEEQKRQIQNGRLSPQQKQREHQRIEHDIQELRADRQEYEQDLILVSEPFGIDLKFFRDLQRPTGVSKASRRSKEPAVENTQLQHIFYVVLVMALIEVIVIYKKYDFLNLLVLMTSLSIFMFNYFDGTYLKLCGGLASISVVADFTWLVMYGGSFWSPSLHSQNSSAQSGYLKLIVLLTLINIAAKVYLIYLILKQNNLGSDNEYMINPFEGVTFNVAGNGDNLITKTCKGAIGGYL